MILVQRFLRFAAGSARLVARGNRAYWAWLLFLAVLIASGGFGKMFQVTSNAHELTGDPVAAWP